MSDIDLIGSHGQTIHHLPEKLDMFGVSVRSTLQIGDPSVIAAITGVCTVGDFRMAGPSALLVEPTRLHLFFTRKFMLARCRARRTGGTACAVL
jgi:hypothetical protein